MSIAVRRLAWVVLPLAAACVLVLTALAPAEGDKEQLAIKAQAILKANCYSCHGEPGKIKKKLNLFDAASYLDKARKVVVPNDPDHSKLVERIEDPDEDNRMPPADKQLPRLSKADCQVLRDWIAAGAPAYSGKPAEAVATTRPAETTPPKGTGSIATAAAVTLKDPKQLAADTKQLFRQRCAQCHSAPKPKGKLDVLDHEALLRDGIVTPSKPEASELYAQVASGRMPQPGNGRSPLSQAEKDLVRDWIGAGAPAFPADVAATGQVGEDYVLKTILKDVRKVKENQAQDADFVRYFSLNHLVAAGVSDTELEDHRRALALVINHLSLMKDFVRPEPVDKPLNTVFRVDLRKLGWDKKPFEGSDLNLFDLALLEYPYGVAALASQDFDALNDEFLGRIHQVRPVPYVRGDWFVSVASQPPLYEDFLQLPLEEKKLEERLGVDSDGDIGTGSARRAGMSVSGVSHNNRVVERHPGRNVAYYWKSYDFRSSKGTDNIFQDPVDLHRTGGEMIFPLQNGLQGYFVCNARGERLAAAPTEIVTDDNAADKAVRNGLSCIRCHIHGMQDAVHDEVLPAVQLLLGNPGTFTKGDVERLYARPAEMAGYLKQDRQDFDSALARLFGDDKAGGSERPGVRERTHAEELAAVSRRFLDAPLSLRTAAAELGLKDPATLESVFRDRNFAALGLVQLGAKGAVRRDSWEDFYDQVVRNLSAGEPIVALDGVTRSNYQPADAPFQLEVSLNKPGPETKNRLQVVLVNKTDANRGVFASGDKVEVQVINNTNGDAFVEVFFNSFRGQKVPLPPPGHGELKAGESFRVAVKRGETAKYDEVTVQPTPGSEQVVVFAGDAEFPAGERLTLKGGAEARGEAVEERVVHRFYELDRNGRGLRLKFDPSHVVKRTLAVETR